MDIGLPTTETPGGVNFLSPGLRTLEGRRCVNKTGPMWSSAAWRCGITEGVGDCPNELARRRRGLGHLTREQETVIEDLLFRTVNKVSELAGRILERAGSSLRARGSSGHSCSVARIGRRHRGNH